MHVVAVVQARTHSTRLPGKVLYPLAGRPVLAHVVDRLRTASTVDDVVVATSTRQADDAVAHAAERAGAGVHRGSESDVLGRMYGAAVEAGADVVVRGTADNPLVPPALTDRVVEAVAAGADYASNTVDRTFPHGLIVEAFSMDTFDEVESASTEPHQREHVTQYYLEQPEEFDLVNVVWGDVFDWTPAVAYDEIRLTVDEPADYELLWRLYEGVDPDDRGIVPVREAIAYAVEEGHVDLNADVQQVVVDDG